MNTPYRRPAAGLILAAVFFVIAGCTHAVYVEDTPNRAGGDIHKMRHDGNFDQKISGLPDNLRMPALSPNKEEIAYAKLINGLNHDVFVVDLDTKAPKNITEGKCFASPPCDEIHPDWSPNGREVVFEVNVIRDSGAFLGPSEIAKISASGSGPMVGLTADTSQDKEPAWGASAKSGRIAFSSNRSGNFKIYTMKADGSDVQLVPGQGSGDNRQPEWCAETDLQTIDHAIAFVSDRAGNDEIYIVDYGVSNPQVRRLTNDPGRDSNPTCLVGGVAFISNRSGTREIWKVPYSGGAAAALVQNNKNKSDLN